MVQKFMQYLVTVAVLCSSVVGLDGAAVSQRVRGQSASIGVRPAKVKPSAKQARYTTVKAKAQRKKEAEKEAERKKRAAEEEEKRKQEEAQRKANLDISIVNAMAGFDFIPLVQPQPQPQVTEAPPTQERFTAPQEKLSEKWIISEEEGEGDNSPDARPSEGQGVGNAQTLASLPGMPLPSEVTLRSRDVEALNSFSLDGSSSSELVTSSPPLLRRGGPEYNENIAPLALTPPAQNATHSTSLSSIRTDIAEGSVPPVSRLSVRQTPQNGRDSDEGLSIVDNEVDAVPQSSVGRNGATSSGATSRQKRRAAYLATQQPGSVNIPPPPPSLLPGQVMSGAPSLQRRSSNRSSHASDRERKYKLDGYVHDSSSSQDSFSSGSDNEEVLVEALQYGGLPEQMSLREGRIPGKNRNDGTTTTTFEAIPKLQDFRNYDQKPVFKVVTNDQSSTNTLVLTSNENGDLIISQVESINKDVIEVARRPLSNGKVTFVDLGPYALIVGYAGGLLERWQRRGPYAFELSSSTITPLLSPPSHLKQNPVFDYKEGAGGKEILLTLNGFYVQEAKQREYRRQEMFPVGVAQEEDAEFIGFQGKNQPKGMALGSKYYRSIWKVGPMAYKIFERPNAHGAFQTPTIWGYNYIDYFAAASDASTILMHSQADNTITLLRDDLSKRGAVLQKVPQSLRSDAAKIKDSTVLALGVDAGGEFGLSVHPDGWLKIWDLRLPGKEALGRVERIEKEFRRKRVVAATLTTRPHAGPERIMYYYIGFADGTVACDVVVLRELPSDGCCTIM